MLTKDFIKLNCVITILHVVILISLFAILVTPDWYSNASLSNFNSWYPHLGRYIYFYFKYFRDLHLFFCVVLLMYLHFARIVFFLESLSFYFASDRLDSYRYISSLFLGFLSLVYLVAFSSLLWQFPLVSETGLIPYKEFAAKTFISEGYRAYLNYPSIFWLSQSNWFIGLVLIVACLLSSIGIFCRRYPIVFLLQWVIYLSIVTFGRDLFQFPWDTFLLEIGVLAIFVVYFISKYDRLPRLLLVVLLVLFCRQWLSMALTKILWSDPAWHNLTFMKYYWLNVPSPTPFAWYMYNLPIMFHKIVSALALLFELLIPLLLLFGRRGRIVSFFLSLFMSCAIQLTGNFGFFNLTTAILGFWCLDDLFFGLDDRFKERKLINFKIFSFSNPTFVFSSVIITVILVLNCYYIVNLFIPQPDHASFKNYSILNHDRKYNLLPPFLSIYKTVELFSHFRIVSPHGVFKVIPKKRFHLAVYVNNGDDNWKKLDFRQGRDVLDFSFTAPFMNRLSFNFSYQAYGVDFRSSFVRLNPNTYVLNSWTKNLMIGILKGNSEINKLFGRCESHGEAKSVKVVQFLCVPIGSSKSFSEVVTDSVVLYSESVFSTPLLKSQRVVWQYR